MTAYESFRAVCGDLPWLAEAYHNKRITDDGLKELLFYLADSKGREVSLLLPAMREQLLEHVRLFLLADQKHIINRLSVTKQIRTAGFMLERELYRHCADIDAYLRTSRERFRLTLLRLYGPQKNELYQTAWRTDFANGFAAADHVRCRQLLFLFAFRKLSYIGGMDQATLRKYEERLLYIAKSYALDLEFLKKNFAVEYQHVSKKIEQPTDYVEQQAKLALRMVGPT